MANGDDFERGYQKATIETLCDCVDEMKESFGKIEKKIDSMSEEMKKISVNNAEMRTEFKIKSGMWGSLAGVISVLFLLALQWAKDKI